MPNNPLPVFILVRPQLAENMGMAARAMMNCGISQMRIVASKENPLLETGIRAASGADEILRNAQIFDTLEDAVRDLNFVLATTARPRDMVKSVFTPEKAACLLKQKENLKTGILFGCERTGLENDELVIADGILSIPLNPEHTSLNLSQAVLLVGYEYSKVTGYMVEHGTENTPAPKNELTLFLNALEKVLDQSDYFKIPDKKPKMKRNIENIFTRAELTSQEIRTLYGLVEALSKKELHWEKK